MPPTKPGVRHTPLKDLPPETNPTGNSKIILQYQHLFIVILLIKEVKCLLIRACVGIYPGRVEPASPIALTTSRTEALQARQFCASSLDTFTKSFLHCAWPKTRVSRSALIVVAHVFSGPPACLSHVPGGVGRRRPLISSPSRRLAA